MRSYNDINLVRPFVCVCVSVRANVQPISTQFLMKTLFFVTKTWMENIIRIIAAT